MGPHARRLSRAGAAGVALLAVGCAALDRSQAPPPARRAAAPAGDDDAIEFVVGNVQFLLVHELAHFLIAEKNVPIIGPEENAADYIATLALIREEPLDPAEQDRGLRFLISAADAFAAAWRIGTALGTDIPYWGSHALSIQRYFQLACLLYGSDAEAFARLPELVGLPDERAQQCTAEYRRADRSIDWLLDNYGRRAGDPPGVPTPVRYGEPRSLIARRVVDALRVLELPERVLERLHERFTLEHPFALVLRDCGQAEAAWLPDRRELLICHELLDTLYLLGRRPDRPSLGAASGGR